ncbi:uncharacterized protein T551_00565 [Pneumocystis jirovecii RU7]|uniref:Uncharacterized protein n=1 Tax=Pneumocystis jirovecii (strain RU7) TaxID=1408657 RepID=A0A0W4ZVS3_PNEJ7|nr:uncharacterized protein T551_00565 [Pneumocystis jirovecii RU7]KTW32475.1 hypothetical protein T551_00565 [Pneumocystis jirovecii RU7]
MFGTSKTFGASNTSSTNQQTFSFNQPVQTSVTTGSQPTFSFETQLQQQTNKPPSFSFFGNKAPSDNIQTAGINSLNSQAQPSTSFLFGNTFQKTAPIVGSTGLAQTQKANSGSLSQTNTILQSPQTISRTSRYSDFPKEGKAFLDEMNQYITTQTQISDHLLSRTSYINELIDSVPRDVEEVSKRLDQAATALTSDISQLMSLKTTVEKDYNSAKLSKNAVDSTPMPYIDSSHTKDSILAYFEDTSNEIEKKINNYAKTIDDIGKNLGYLEKDHSEEKGNPEALLNTLKAEYDFFLALSNNAAEVHDKIKQLGTQNLVTNIISR